MLNDETMWLIVLSLTLLSIGTLLLIAAWIAPRYISSALAKTGLAFLTCGILAYAASVILPEISTPLVAAWTG